MNDNWPRLEDDFMELGDSSWIPAKDGWFIHKFTGERLDPDGRRFAENGDLIFDPNKE